MHLDLYNAEMLYKANEMPFSSLLYILICRRSLKIQLEMFLTRKLMMIWKDKDFCRLSSTTIGHFICITLALPSVNLQISNIWHLYHVNTWNTLNSDFILCFVFVSWNQFLILNIWIKFTVLVNVFLLQVCSQCERFVDLPN